MVLVGGMVIEIVLTNTLVGPSITIVDPLPNLVYIQIEFRQTFG